MADPKSAMNGSGPDDTLGLRARLQTEDEGTLRETARELIQTGKLPNRPPDRLWGGPGAGANCVICNSPIERHQLEYEMEFARNGDGAGLHKYHLHVRCFAAWESHLVASPGSDVVPKDHCDAAGRLKLRDSP